MFKRILMQSGFLAGTLCLLATAVTVHDTYKLYVDHENAKIAGIHEAYQRSFDAAMGHVIQHEHAQRAIDEIASVVDVNLLMPKQTKQKIGK